MQARIICRTGGAFPCALRFVRPDVHGVGACVGFLFASHYRSIVRGDRAMCSVSTNEAAQAAAAPARLRCVPPECSGARRRTRLLLWLNGWFSFAAVVLSWRCRSMVSVSAPIRMRCRLTRALAGAVGVRISWSFGRRFRVLLGAFASSFAQALATWLLWMHSDCCSRALLVAASWHVTCQWLPPAFPARTVMHV